MKIRYEFVNGEVSEIEVDEGLGELLVDFDREQYNNDHKETRRHCSLEAYNLDDGLLPSDENVEQRILQAERDGQLYDALAHLNADQQELVRAIFFKGMSVSEYGKRHGISQPAVSQRKIAVLKKLKNFMC